MHYNPITAELDSLPAGSIFRKDDRDYGVLDMAMLATFLRHHAGPYVLELDTDQLRTMDPKTVVIPLGV